MDRRTLPPRDAPAACEHACLATHAVLSRLAAARTAGRSEDPLARLLRDCAEVCLATAGDLRADSVFRGRMLEACADICGECAATCAADDGLAEAVSACRDCARHCQAARDVAGT
jgi:hypothetical protein